MRKKDGESTTLEEVSGSNVEIKNRRKKTTRRQDNSLEVKEDNDDFEYEWQTLVCCFGPAQKVCSHCQGIRKTNGQRHVFNMEIATVESSRVFQGTRRITIWHGHEGVFNFQQIQIDKFNAKSSFNDREETLNLFKLLLGIWCEMEKVFEVLCKYKLSSEAKSSPPCMVERHGKF